MSRLESIMLKYCVIILFWNSSMLLLLFPCVLLLCLYFIIEEHLELEEGQKSVPPTGICLSPLFIVAAVTDGQNVTVLMLVVASPSSVS